MAVSAPSILLLAVPGCSARRTNHENDKVASGSYIILMRVSLNTRCGTGFMLADSIGRMAMQYER
jgi:hypothetical protein